MKRFITTFLLTAVMLLPKCGCKGKRCYMRDGQRQVAAISKELFHLTDTYTIDVADPRDALGALLVVLAIDAEKCSRS